MANKIETKPLTVDANFAADPHTWLAAKAKELKWSEVYLLSFHDDGVVWGKIANEQLLTSDKLKDSAGNDLKTPSPKFQLLTLQELRLFGENGELHIWRDDENKFQARTASESETGDFEFLEEEKQVLWGTDDDGGNADFMIVRDGSEGLKHAFPIIDKSKFNGARRPLRLRVRHYIEYDADGCTRITLSRLAGVSVD